MHPLTLGEQIEAIDLGIDDAKVAKLERIAKARGVSIVEARAQVFNEGLDEALRRARLASLTAVPKSH